MPLVPLDLRYAFGGEEEVRIALHSLRHSIQRWAVAAITTPYDTQRLRNMDLQIEGFAHLTPDDQVLLKQFVRAFGRREKKRPRDRLLRDRSTRSVVMEVRKKTAFLGYTWRRKRPTDVDWPSLLSDGQSDGKAD